MTKGDLGCLTERHLMLFGTIIHWFARHELLMQEVMATVSSSDVASIMILTRDFDFSRKRKALLDLLRHRTVPLDQFDRVGEYLIVLDTLTPLRNDIAHSGWISGQSSSWIQPDWILRPAPSIKPLRDDPAAPGTHYFEQEQENIAYTLDDLSQIVDTLTANHEAFSEYLRNVGLIGGIHTSSGTSV